MARFESTTVNDAVTVYCANSPEAPARFVAAAEELGRLAAASGLATVTGAGSAGLMGAVVRGTLSAGGRAIGVIPRFMVDRGWCNPAMTECHVTETMHERKALLASLGRGAIALPGGIGTMDELMDLLTLCQLGLYRHPVVILNIDGFYSGLLSQFVHADSCDMMRHTGLTEDLWTEVSEPSEAIRIMANHIESLRTEWI